MANDDLEELGKVGSQNRSAGDVVMGKRWMLLSFEDTDAAEDLRMALSLISSDGEDKKSSYAKSQMARKILKRSAKKITVLGGGILE